MAYEFYITPEEYAIAKTNGINEDALENRIRHLGWGKEEALNTPIKRRDENIKDLLCIAKENGIKRSTFDMRLRRGWSEKEAATLPIITNKESIRNAKRKQPRIFTDEELKHAESLGIKRTTLYRRVGPLRWSKEEAVSTPTMKKEKTTLYRGPHETLQLNCNTN